MQMCINDNVPTEYWWPFTLLLMFVSCDFGEIEESDLGLQALRHGGEGETEVSRAQVEERIHLVEQRMIIRKSIFLF